MTTFYFWTEYLIEGRAYAERSHFVTVASAREAHAEACEFRWATAAMAAPRVGPLYAVAPDRREVEIQPAATARQPELA
jgi:hypothetical protein